MSLFIFTIFRYELCAQEYFPCKVWLTINQIYRILHFKHFMHFKLCMIQSFSFWLIVNQNSFRLWSDSLMKMFSFSQFFWPTPVTQPPQVYFIKSQPARTSCSDFNARQVSFCARRIPTCSFLLATTALARAHTSCTELVHQPERAWLSRTSLCNSQGGHMVYVNCAPLYDRRALYPHTSVGDVCASCVIRSTAWTPVGNKCA